MEKKLLEGIGTLVGLTIGAGILGIPYVVAKAGFFTGAFVILFLGLIIILMNLYVGEITLRTKGRHQLPGYVEKYLGKKGKFFMTISLMITVYGALTSYIIGEGQAWAAILNISPLYPMLIFFTLMAIIVFRGLKLIKTLEVCINTFIIAVLLVIVLLSIQGIEAENYTEFNAAKLLIPYGVVLFAFAGSAAIPDIKAELGKNKKLMKKAILIGTAIPLCLYLLFAFVIVGVTGTESTELATVALGEQIGLHMLFLGNIFAAFAMGTSFLLLALALLWMYQYDYKMKKIFAWALTLSIPLIIAFSNHPSFIQVLAITGTFAGGLEGILIVLTHRAAQKKSERKPEYSLKSNLFLNILLIAIYIIGMVYMIYII
ncbi:MAG: aromatic amino acid transport family protein [bacterium]|nr:aromatic amino acid transport family protein [bacterium]